jgi:hypothetical protein
MFLRNVGIKHTSSYCVTAQNTNIDIFTVVRTSNTGEISGSHDGVYEDDRLLGFCAV